jgi:hypothetical protein
VLSDSQDKVLKRVQDLKDQIEADRKSRVELENQFKNQLLEKNTLIDELRNQVCSIIFFKLNKIEF